MKTRPTHSSCRDSVGLLAPRYMDGFCQPPLSLALFPHAYVRTRPCLFSLRSCPPRYQPGETIYFTGLALRSTGVVEFSLSLSLSLSLLPSRSLLRREMKVRTGDPLFHLINIVRWFTTALNHSLNGILDRSTERNFISPGFRANRAKDRTEKQKKNFDPRKLCVFPKFERREGGREWDKV